MEFGNILEPISVPRQVFGNHKLQMMYCNRRILFCAWENNDHKVED